MIIWTLYMKCIIPFELIYSFKTFKIGTLTEDIVAFGSYIFTCSLQSYCTLTNIHDFWKKKSHIHLKTINETQRP